MKESTTCDYNATTLAVVKGTKTEVAPGVWRLRVYIGRDAKGNPVQRSKTIHTGDKNAKPGAGTRLADRELANMIAEANKGNTATGTETVSGLLDLFLDHKESTGRSPETLRGVPTDCRYRRAPRTRENQAQ